MKAQYGYEWIEKCIYGQLVQYIEDNLSYEVDTSILSCVGYVSYAQLYRISAALPVIRLKGIYGRGGCQTLWR